MAYTAIVQFYNKEKGGRTVPPIPGYKPHLKVGDELTSCIITPQDTRIKKMEFGVRYEVNIELIFDSIYKDKLYSNMIIELFEGRRKVGEGILLED